MRTSEKKKVGVGVFDAKNAPFLVFAFVVSVLIVWFCFVFWPENENKSEIVCVPFRGIFTQFCCVCLLFILSEKMKKSRFSASSFFFFVTRTLYSILSCMPFLHFVVINKKSRFSASSLFFFVTRTQDVHGDRFTQTAVFCVCVCAYS